MGFSCQGPFSSLYPLCRRTSAGLPLSCLISRRCCTSKKTARSRGNSGFSSWGPREFITCPKGRPRSGVKTWHHFVHPGSSSDERHSEILLATETWGNIRFISVCSLPVSWTKLLFRATLNIIELLLPAEYLNTVHSPTLHLTGALTPKYTIHTLCCTLFHL